MPHGLNLAEIGNLKWLPEACFQVHFMANEYGGKHVFYNHFYILPCTL
jgi:hypothetical protein